MMIGLLASMMLTSCGHFGGKGGHGSDCKCGSEQGKTCECGKKADTTGTTKKHECEECKKGS